MTLLDVISAEIFNYLVLFKNRQSISLNPFNTHWGPKRESFPHVHVAQPENKCTTFIVHSCPCFTTDKPRLFSLSLGYFTASPSRWTGLSSPHKIYKVLLMAFTPPWGPYLWHWVNWRDRSGLMTFGTWLTLITHQAGLSPGHYIQTQLICSR